jgi:UDP-glucose:(heptosyl)LPS alpha-1,3-glucosyltransferase
MVSPRASIATTGEASETEIAAPPWRPRRAIRIHGWVHIALVHMRHAGSGGTERYLNELAAHLAREGEDVEIVCRSHEDAPHPSLRFRTLRPFAIGGAWRMGSFARAVERFFARERYDVVFGLGKTWTHDLVRLGGGCHATYLALAHASTQTALERRLGIGARKQRLALEIEARALAPAAARRVIVNSRMVARDVERRYGIAADKLEVVHNGVDLERFHPTRHRAAAQALRASAGLAEDDLVVLFLGSGYGRKGLDLLLDAFAAIAERRASAAAKLRLLVAGYESALSIWRARARQLGLGERVRFLGGRRDPEVCFAAADLYVLPTRYDPFANSTLEALASGLAVLTSDANGASELLDSGVHGEVVPVAAPAALAAALESWCNPERIEPARVFARARAEEHGVDSKNRRTHALLQSVAAEVAGSR